jgi:hypothetical protein
LRLLRSRLRGAVRCICGLSLCLERLLPGTELLNQGFDALGFLLRAIRLRIQFSGLLLLVCNRDLQRR